MAKTKAFVFYETWYNSFLELSRKDEGLAKNFLKAVVDYGFTSSYDESDIVINALMSNVTQGIDNAQERYNKSQEIGSTGGRPSKHKAEVYYKLFDEGKDCNEVADILGVSLRTAQRYAKSYKDDKTT